jgi:hypothetical protein
MDRRIGDLKNLGLGFHANLLDGAIQSSTSQYGHHRPPRHAMASAVRDNGNTSLIISVENIVIPIHNIAWLPEHEIVITTKRSLS